jgi:hypothetical protein
MKTDVFMALHCPLAGIATPALSGCPCQQGRWAGDEPGLRDHGFHGFTMNQLPITNL